MCSFIFPPVYTGSEVNPLYHDFSVKTEGQNPKYEQKVKSDRLGLLEASSIELEAAQRYYFYMVGGQTVWFALCRTKDKYITTSADSVHPRGICDISNGDFHCSFPQTDRTVPPGENTTVLLGR